MSSNVEETQRQRNAVIRKKMLDIRDVDVVALPDDSPWLRPVRITYLQNDNRKVWDVMRAHDSVMIVVFNVTRKKLVFVRQFRPASYYSYLPEKKQKQVELDKYPPTKGLTIELCAGIVDKNLSLVEIASEELKEECGYEAPASAFTEIITYRCAF